MLKEANLIQDRAIAAMNLAIETPDEVMAIREGAVGMISQREKLEKARTVSGHPWPRVKGK
eukprot:7082280-Heterocapsa_arctica.AAC.1